MNYKRQYRDQKYQAKKRGLDFNFTYEEWLDWWGEDITKRGHCKGNLVMSRYGDIGPYHPDNVFKNTQEQNISAAQKGKTQSDELKAKKSAAQKGRPKSEETRARMRGRPKSEEHRAKLSAAGKGKTLSEEHRAKISAARKAYLAKKKETTNVEN
jgi:NUMOD3 motif